MMASNKYGLKTLEEAELVIDQLLAKIERDYEELVQVGDALTRAEKVIYMKDRIV